MAPEPQLKACVFYGSNGSSLIVEQGERTFRIDLEAGTAPAFRHFCTLLDGRHSLEQLAAATGLSRGDTAGLVDALSEADLLVARGPADRVDGAAFCEALGAAARMWRRHMLSHRLFDDLLAAGPDDPLLAAMLIETLFYVRFSEEAVGLACAGGLDQPYAEILVALRESERGHDEYILECLDNIGLPGERLAQLRPSLATEAVGLFLKESARRDPIVFLALLSLTESSPGDVALGVEYVRELERVFRLAPGALRGLSAHLELDSAEGHSSSLERALASGVALDSARADDIVDCVHRFKHFMDGMNDWIAGCGKGAARGVSAIRYAQIA